MTTRDAEVARYVALYAAHGRAYRTPIARRALFAALLSERPDLADAGLLDVGAGHGDLLDMAYARGYAPLAGTEVVPSLLAPPVVYGTAWALPFPDGAFGTVSCFDVLEHLLPDDVPAALAEMARVARDRIIIEVSCRPSNWRDARGQLHMTIWTPDEWAAAACAAWYPRFDLRRRTDLPLERAAALFDAIRHPPQRM